MKMKHIHFDNFNNKFWIGVLILSIICFLIGVIEPIEFSNQSIYKYMSSSAYFLQALFLSKLFWFKNIVQWNAKGIVIRINSFLGKSLRFDEITATEFNERIITLTTTNGRKVLIDLNKIADDDALKLNKIIIENTIANN